MIEEQKIVEVRALRREFNVKIKNRKKVEALKGIDFYIYKGEIFGLLGPNGAGKTTTIKILATMLTPTEGEAKVLGFNCSGEEKRIREKINFVLGGELGLYWKLTGKENLLYFSDLYKIPRKRAQKKVDELLEKVGLEKAAEQKVEQYSKGMKQRLQIARSLINDPEIIFFDEPTIGLDPQGAFELRKLMLDLKKDGKTILLTTHYMDEAEKLCDRVALINEGRIVDCNTVGSLKDKYLGSRNGTLEEVYLKLFEEK